MRILLNGTMCNTHDLFHLTPIQKVSGCKWNFGFEVSDMCWSTPHVFTFESIPAVEKAGGLKKFMAGASNKDKMFDILMGRLNNFREALKSEMEFFESREVKISL